MAESDLTLTTQWPQTLDEDYARRRLDAEMEALLAEGPPPYEIRGKPGQGTEDVSPAAPQPPSAIAAGVTAGATAAGEGAKNVLQGLTNLFSMTPAPGETLPEQVTAGLKGKVDAAKQVLMDGLMQLGLSPLTGGFVGVGQALENRHPDVAAAQVAEGMAAAGIRGILSGRAFKDLSPEEQAAAVQPLTVREALEMAGPMLAPALAGPAIKGAKAAKRANVALGERGAIGAPPPAQPVSRLNITRIDAAESVKRLMRDVNTAQSEALAEHRAVQGHAATIEASRGIYRTVEDALAAPLEELILEKPKALAFRDWFNRVGTEAERLAVLADRGDADAAMRFADAWALMGEMAQKDEMAGAGLARGLEARKIPSTAERAGPRVAQLTAQERAITAEIAFREAEVSQLSKDLGATPEGRNVAALERQADRLEQRAQALDTRLAEAKSDEAAAGLLRDEIAALREEAKKIKAEIASAKAGGRDLGALGSQQERLTRQIDDLQKALADAKTEAQIKAVLKEQITIDQALAKDLREQITAARGTGNFQASQAAMERAQARVDELTQQLADTVQEARILQQIRHGRAFSMEQVRQLRDEITMAGIDPVDLARRYLALQKRQRATFVKQTWAGIRAGYDIVHEAWIQGLLSNPLSTDVANVLGSVGTILVDLPETYAAEIVNRIRRDPAGTRPGEAWAKTTAIGEGLVDGVRLAGKALQEGRGAFGGEADLLSFSNKAGEQRGFFKASTFGMDPETGAAMAVNALIPTTRMAAEDAVFKGTAYTMSLRAQAHRQALMEGTTTPAELAKRKSELFDAPTPRMIAEAVEEAKRLTMNQPLGEFGQAVNKVIQLSVVGPWIVPFRSISGNVMKWFGQRAPILAQISSTNRADMAAGGVLADKAIARQLTGVAVTSAVMYLVSQGKITGGGNPDRALKRMEREEQPTFSFRVGDVWVKYDRYDPVGALVGVVADYAELLHYIPHQDALDEWAAYGEALVLAAGHVMINKSFMRGLADAFNAIKEPDRQGAAWMKQFAGSLVPASSAMRAVTRALDDQVVRDARTIVDKLKAGIPFLADGVPPLRNNITGEVFRYGIGGPSPLLPLYVYTEKQNDPVILEILRNRIGLAPVPWVIGGGSAKSASDRPQMTEPMQVPPILLTPKQRDFWIVEMTQKVKLGAHDDNLYQALDRAMRSDEYRTLSPEDRGGYFKAIYGAYREVGLANLLNPETGSPTLQAKMLQRAEEVGRRHLPTDNPESPYFGGANPSRLNRRLPGSLTR